MIIDLINTCHKDECPHPHRYHPSPYSDIVVREILINPFPKPIKVKIVHIGSADRPATMKDIADAHRRMSAAPGE